MLQPEPEIGEIFDDLGIVADGSTQVTRLFKQQGTIEESHQVVGLQLQHKVEVLDAPVVITHLSTEQTSVIVTKEIVGFYIKGCVIVGHSPTEIILIIACHRTVDIVAGMLRKQFNAL